MNKNRSNVSKKMWTELKKRPMVDDSNLLDIIYTVIDRGYTGGAHAISATEMYRIWGKDVRRVFAIYSVRKELKSRGYRYWKMDEYLIKKIDEFVKQKKLRLTPTRKKGCIGNHNYYYLKKPMEA